MKAFVGKQVCLKRGTLITHKNAIRRLILEQDTKQQNLFCYNLYFCVISWIVCHLHAVPPLPKKMKPTRVESPIEFYLYRRVVS